MPVFSEGADELFGHKPNPAAPAARKRHIELTLSRQKEDESALEKSRARSRDSKGLLGVCDAREA